MNTEALYQIALTMVPGIGAIQAKTLLDTFGSAVEVFKAKKSHLGTIERIGTHRASAIKDFSDFEEAEKELAFCEKHKIEVLYPALENYPKRLLHCYDAPTLLFYKGTANLNAERMVSIVGTRNNTDYGKQQTEKLVNELSSINAIIISGLALGIDTIAHKAALSNEMITIGVMGNGFKNVYPASNKSLAREMAQSGGLLTEFIHETKPDKHNFPRRNRIVAGMADCTVVVETASKGGSMITAELAYSYNRDVFSIPGRLTDQKSSGCLKLIKQNKAQLITSGLDVIESMSWIQKKKLEHKKQRSLFIDLTEDEKLIIEKLQSKELTHIDELYYGNGLTSSAVASAILNLEIQGLIKSLPGKMYSLV